MNHIRLNTAEQWRTTFFFRNNYFPPCSQSHSRLTVNLFFSCSSSASMKFPFLEANNIICSVLSMNVSFQNNRNDRNILAIFKLSVLALEAEKMVFHLRHTWLQFSAGAPWLARVECHLRAHCHQESSCPHGEKQCELVAVFHFLLWDAEKASPFWRSLCCLGLPVFRIALLCILLPALRFISLWSLDW